MSYIKNISNKLGIWQTLKIGDIFRGYCRFQTLEKLNSFLETIWNKNVAASKRN